MGPLRFLGALAIGALDGAARVAIPGFYRATGDDRADLQDRADKADADREAVAKRAASMLVEAQKRTAEANRRAEALADHVRRAEERAREAEAKDAKGVKALADALRGIDRLTAEVKALTARGEPAAWLVRFVQSGVEGTTACVVEDTADKLAVLYRGTKTALYETPPRALGVDDDRWAVIDASGIHFIALDGDHEIGSREQAWRLTTGARVRVRLVRESAAVVDIGEIRTALASMEQLDGGDTAPGLAAIRAAIGDKEGA